MSAKDRVLDGFEVFGMTRENAEIMYKHLVAAVKDEMIPKDQTYQEFFGIDHPKKLIQGYTAENWQEIIDGGYLCEYWGGSYTENCGDKPIGTLEEVKSGEYPFQQGGNCSDWSFCRPAHLKGVMRPIFVEPVDKEAWCHFFLGEDRVRYGKYENVYTAASNAGATAYIEL